MLMRPKGRIRKIGSVRKMYDLQKANVWKRAFAGLFDLIMVSCLIVGLACGFSAAFRYDSHFEKLEAMYEKYEKEYGIILNISAEDYQKLSDEEKAKYAQADEAFRKDADVQAVYAKVFGLSVAILSLSIFVGVMLLELVVPLLFGNGQTIGKKLFGLAVMRVDGVKITGPFLFIRTLIGKFTVEIMIPVLIVVMLLFGMIGIMGTITIGLILLLQIVLMIATKTNSLLHDVFSQTVVVDMASQMIFGSEAELIAYKTQAHAEKVKSKTY